MSEASVSSVLMVHNRYQQAGGEDAVFEQESEMLERAGVRVERYVRSNDGIRGILGKLKVPFEMVFSLRTYREVRRLVREKGIDVVHCHNTFPLVSASVYWAACKEGAAVVQTVHNYRLVCPNALCFRGGTACTECLARGPFHAVRRRCYRDSALQTLAVALMLAAHRTLGAYRKTTLVFLTDFQAELHETFVARWADGRCRVKPNFSPEPTGLKPSQRSCGPYLLYVGRFDVNKGVSDLLSLWAEAGGRTGLRLVFVGDGDLADEVIRAQEALSGLECLGRRPHQEVLSLIAGAEALVFPSICFEGMPMGIVEAFSVGTPVIAANVGNHARMVRDAEAGACYAPGDPGSFADAVADVVDRRLSCSKAALRVYRARYAEDSNLRILMSIYAEAMECEEASLDDFGGSGQCGCGFNRSEG